MCLYFSILHFFCIFVADLRSYAAFTFFHHHSSQANDLHVILLYLKWREIYIDIVKKWYILISIYYEQTHAYLSWLDVIFFLDDRVFLCYLFGGLFFTFSLVKNSFGSLIRPFVLGSVGAFFFVVVRSFCIVGFRVYGESANKWLICWHRPEVAMYTEDSNMSKANVRIKKIECNMKKKEKNKDGDSSSVRVTTVLRDCYQHGLCYFLFFL